MIPLIPFIPLGIVAGKIYFSKNSLDKTIYPQDITSLNEEIKLTQKELSRAYHLKNTNQKLEEYSELDKIDISINNVPIEEDIERLKKYMQELLTLKRALNENN